jgi:glutamate---methylamine ligase
VLAAGLDGIAEKRDPGKRLDVNMYEIGHTLKNVRRLPLNLLDALRGFAASKMLRAALGDELVDSYVKLRMAEWQDYSRHLTQWERDRTLDC